MDFHLDMLASALRAQVAAGVDGVVLDLVGVPFMDSSGLKQLLAASNELRDRLIVVLSPGSPVRRLLELAEIADRIAVRENPDEAVAALAPSGGGPVPVSSRAEELVALDRLRGDRRELGDAILSKDVEGVITSWNPAAARIYGYTEDEAVGQPISMLVPPHRVGEEGRILDQVLGGQRLEHYETERLTKDGEQIVVSLTVSPLAVRAERDRRGASVIARDITDRHRTLALASRLQALTSALSKEITRERTLEVLLEQAVPALGADAGAVGLVERRRGPRSSCSAARATPRRGSRVGRPSRWTRSCRCRSRSAAARAAGRRRRRSSASGTRR